MHWIRELLMDYNANECSLKILDIKNSLVHTMHTIFLLFSVLISKGMLF